jgi:hypothetical protein
MIEALGPKTNPIKDQDYDYHSTICTASQMHCKSFSTFSLGFAYNQTLAPPLA